MLGGGGGGSRTEGGDGDIPLAEDHCNLLQKSLVRCSLGMICSADPGYSEGRLGQAIKGGGKGLLFSTGN
ncbi:hypothetical protein OIU77_023595 [Salix suchowensis]|uniref:Uncharacterized protein n=1 Tax=Salix suchowensis TaxID=1278906 RepID=A0ABQ9C4E9_9ROSI|nr:hypothetical protein OIU77_023595 [Salix suchowensis]